MFLPVHKALVYNRPSRAQMAIARKWKINPDHIWPLSNWETFGLGDIRYLGGQVESQ